MHLEKNKTKQKKYIQMNKWQWDTKINVLLRSSQCLDLNPLDKPHAHIQEYMGAENVDLSLEHYEII